MSAGDVIRPFRWDITKRAQLGTLPDVEQPTTPDGFEEELLRSCARTVAFAGDSDLVFVGRSPEPLFDLLSGLLLDTAWATRLALLNLSFRYSEPPSRMQIRAVRPYFEQVGVTPEQLASSSRPVAFVDVVDTGDTFGSLLDMIAEWARADGVEWRAVARKIRIVGLTWREPASPYTYRWQQGAEWVERLRPHAVKNVSVDPTVMTYLASLIPKLSASFPPEWWTEASAAQPLRGKEQRIGLALAARLFDLGRERDARLEFARELAAQPAMTERWFRSLILELKR